MKLKVMSKGNTEVGSKELPAQFSEPVRPDIIKRAVLALQANARQPYGAMPKAGMRHAADLSRRRRKYRGSYGFGISRVPRKILSRRGTRFNWEGAVMPGVKGGRRAHPPKVEKKWTKKVNKKENRKAIRSAMAATLDTTWVADRGHKVPKNYPFIASNEIESISKTSELTSVLQKMGFTEELLRTQEPRKRAGMGKLRGRRKSFKRGLLIVVADQKAPVINAASNIPGVEAIPVKTLNADVLAPGSHPGRITLFTEPALDVLKKDEVFA